MSASRIKIEMARCFNDRREALSLIHSAHVRAGLPSRSENALRVTPHQLLPRSRIFVAKVDGRVVSTLSLIPDSPAGLPLDNRYREQLDQLRQRGLRVAEVGCFADRRSEGGKFVGNFCALVRHTAQYANAQAIDGLVVGGHFGRARFLKNYLGFREELASPLLASASDRESEVPLFLEFERLRVESPEKHRVYFGDSVLPNEFAGGFMPRWEADYFGRPSAAEGDQSAAFPATAARLSAASLHAHAPTL